MKILQVITYFPPAYSYGGALQVSYGISKELVKRGHSVTVLTSDVLNSKSRISDNQLITNMDGINVHRFRIISKYLSKKNMAISPQIILALRKTIKEYDIVHIHEYRSFQAVVACYYAKKNQIPYIVQAHGAVLPIFKKQGIKNLFDIIWGRKILNSAAKVIALTQTEFEQYKSMGVPENKIEIVPNALNTTEFENLPKFGKFRKKHEIPESSKIILYIGRLHRAKGLDLLIDAFYELNKIKNNFQLILIGPDDGYQEHIRNKIQELNLQDKIRIIGFVVHEEKIQAFIDTNVFVTPSYSGFPITFLEACACGTPIVTTTHGDRLDWIDLKVGFVVEYEIIELINAILKLVNDTELCAKFGNAGKNLVHDHFNWEKLIPTLERIYFQAVILKGCSI